MHLDSTQIEDFILPNIHVHVHVHVANLIEKLLKISQMLQ